VKATLKLLEESKGAKDTPESQKQLSGLSEAITDRVMDVVKALRKVPGGESITGLHETGPDYDALAEQELRKTAKVIEDATSRLLDPSHKRTSENDILTEDDIHAAILDAARALGIATSSLVKVASLAQRDRVAKQKDPKTRHFFRPDPAWCKDLIGASQLVGTSTQDLVGAANGFVQKEDGKDDSVLISAARGVASSTSRLMATSRAKSDPFSETHQKLEGASKEVANATQLLVEAARKAAEWVNRPQEVSITLDEDNVSLAAKRKAQLIAQAKMLRLQKEYEAAKSQYSKLGPGSGSTTPTSAGRGRGRGGL